MMLNAGAAASRALEQPLDDRRDDQDRLLDWQGKQWWRRPGNGALPVAIHRKRKISLYLIEPRSTADAPYRAVVDAGLPLALATDDDDRQGLKDSLLHADIIVDAVLGIGARLPLRGMTAEVLAAANRVFERAQNSGGRKRLPFAA